jgi:hypothetical protein
MWGSLWGDDIHILIISLFFSYLNGVIGGGGSLLQTRLRFPGQQGKYRVFLPHAGLLK